MSASAVEDVMAKLRRLKTSSAETFKLVPQAGGDAVTVSRSALRQCSFFEDLLDKQPHLDDYLANCSRDTLLFFKAFVEMDKRLPVLSDAFEGILFGHMVHSDSFVSRCAWSARGVMSPPNSKLGEVSEVVHSMVSALALRTAEYYETLLSMTTSHLSAHERDVVTDRIVEAVNQHKNNDILDPLPIPLFKKRLTVALMTDILGNPVVTVLHNNKWIQFNVFGSKFCPFAEDVRNFHLVYDSYVVYEKSNGEVIMRSLRSEPNDEVSRRVFFHKCKFFKSRQGTLLVISHDESVQMDSLYEWNETLLDFEKRLTIPLDKLQSAYKNKKGDLVGVLAEGKIVELSNAAPDANRDAIADCVDDCQLRVGEEHYTHLGLDNDNRPCQMPLSPPIHIGDSRLSVVSCGGDLYKTQFWKRVENYWKVIAYSKPHGAVKTFADILLVETHIPN